MISFKNQLVIVLIVLVFPFILRGQTEETKKQFNFGIKQKSSAWSGHSLWADISVGPVWGLMIGTDNLSSPLGASLVANYLSPQQRFLKGRIGLTLEGISYTRPFFENRSPTEVICDISVMTGVIFGKKSNAYYELSFGLGVIGGFKKGDFIRVEPGIWGTKIYDEVFFINVGIPIEFKTNFIALEKLGFGVSLQSNVNYKMPYIGLALYVQINNPFKMY